MPRDKAAVAIERGIISGERQEHGKKGWLYVTPTVHGLVRCVGTYMSVSFYEIILGSEREVGEVEEEAGIHEARCTIERLARKYLVGVASVVVL